MTDDELYAHPGWQWCTFEGARRDVLRRGAETTLREKLEWLEEAESLALRFRRTRASNDADSNESRGSILGPTTEREGDEWEEWYRLTPAERWEESSRLWDSYLALGGSLDPEPDSQSPFDHADARRAEPPDGRPGVHFVRRSGV